jgi:hypothetical protein
MLEELAIDPRAFDFLHPAASRPNYLFGLWDPSRIDERGCYRRMVVQQATLDGILSWPQAAAGTGTPDAGIEAQLRRESAAVLAGVMLMASGLSGHGPGSHQASLPLSELLPRIAGYRDEFYRWMMAQLPEEHSRRLKEEMVRLRQPFGGVRRHINTLLASRRAMQVESVSLAGVFARVGRAEAADRMAARVPAASARMSSSGGSGGHGSGHLGNQLRGRGHELLEGIAAAQLPRGCIQAVHPAHHLPQPVLKGGSKRQGSGPLPQVGEVGGGYEGRKVQPHTLCLSHTPFDAPTGATLPLLLLLLLLLSSHLCPPVLHHSQLTHTGAHI